MQTSGGSRISHRGGMDLIGGCGLLRQLRFIKFVCQNERIGSPLNLPMQTSFIVQSGFALLVSMFTSKVYFNATEQKFVFWRHRKSMKQIVSIYLTSKWIWPPANLTGEWKIMIVWIIQDVQISKVLILDNRTNQLPLKILGLTAELSACGCVNVTMELCHDHVHTYLRMSVQVQSAKKHKKTL